ncbi:hypothetical protein BH18VER2_BH18VER2_08740 [soil metagenome]
MTKLTENRRRQLRGAHAPPVPAMAPRHRELFSTSLAGEDIARKIRSPKKSSFRRGAETSVRGARAPQKELPR